MKSDCQVSTILSRKNRHHAAARFLLRINLYAAQLLAAAAHSQTGQGQQRKRGGGGFGDVGNGSVENASRTLIEAYSMLKAAFVQKGVEITDAARVLIWLV